MQHRNPYRLENTEERKKRLTAEAEVRAKLKVIADRARECLADERFIKYREEFTRGKDAILRLMIENTNPDPVMDAFFLRSCLVKIQVLNELLDRVERDTKKEVK